MINKRLNNHIRGHRIISVMVLSYVVSNRDGDPLSYTQFKRLWQYIVTRTVKERFYYRYEDGKRVKHTVTPVLGERQHITEK